MWIVSRVQKPSSIPANYLYLSMVMKHLMEIIGTSPFLSFLWLRVVKENLWPGFLYVLSWAGHPSFPFPPSFCLAHILKEPRQMRTPSYSSSDFWPSHRSRGSTEAFLFKLQGDLVSLALGWNGLQDEMVLFFWWTLITQSHRGS